MSQVCAAHPLPIRSIHGCIELPAAAVAVIDTPHFQRLKWLRQLGSCSYIYPNATHNRFQHSIGVAHLGRVFAEALRNKFPEAGITQKDVDCVLLAGLCHDLGEI